MYDCFISFKKQIDGVLTEDYYIAKNIYNLLSDIGVNVFFSEKTLEQIGTAKYKDEIDNALNSAKTLIVVGTTLENINSNWVKYEWDSFAQDILRGNNADGMIYTVAREDISLNSLPVSLRNYQIFPTTRIGYKNLHNFIVSQFKDEPHIKKNTSICRNCGKVFNISSPRGCSYHPSEPIKKLELNFNNITISTWYYQCCGIEIKSEDKPISQLGCKQDFHIKLSDL